jgi:hypothetical protein
MKRRGCTECHSIEPVAGAWRDGLCPACTEIRKLRLEREAKSSQPVAASPQAPKDPALEATVKRLQHYLTRITELYSDIWRTVDQLRAERGRTLPNWPAWCFMPLAGSYAIASGGRDDAPPEKLGEIAALGALAAWRPTQGIYRFDPTVASAIMDTPLTGELPSEILQRIPEWCVYVETPGLTYLDAPSYGFFAYLEHDANDKREELRLAIDLGTKLATALPVHLGGNLIAGIASATREAVRQAERHQVGADARTIMSLPAEKIAASLEPRINLLLYLCSTNAEMRDRKSGRLRPTKPLLTKTKDGLRMFAAERPAAWEVGYRLGAAIRHAQEAAPKRPGDGTHASPRPHIRRAHWHSFWAGPKAKVGVARTEERKLILHWLPPTPVAVAEDAEVIPTAHRVS